MFWLSHESYVVLYHWIKLGLFCPLGRKSLPE